MSLRGLGAFLLSALLGSAATTEAFAQAVGSLLYRVGGVIAKLQEALNVDGYAVVRLDPTRGQVYLDRAKLNELFEVSL